MARVTVEDCVEVVNNRFNLVLMSSQRARDIGAGQTPFVDRDNDKNTVIALREIADRLVDFDELEAHIARGVNRRTEATEEDDILANIQSEGWLNTNQTGEITDSGGSSIQEIEFEAQGGAEQESEEGDEAEEAAEAEEAPVPTLDEMDDEDIKQAAEEIADVDESDAVSADATEEDLTDASSDDASDDPSDTKASA